MKLFPILLTIVLVGLIYSCKKDKLEGDYAVFAGEWEWVYTEKIVDYCDPDYMYYETLTPISEGTTWEIKFMEKGKVQFYEENNLLNEYRIIFDSFGYQYSGNDSAYTGFEINLDNNDNSKFYGRVSPDSIIVIKDFPYPDNEVFISGQCYLTTSYFVRK